MNLGFQPAGSPPVCRSEVQDRVILQPLFGWRKSKGSGKQSTPTGKVQHSLGHKLLATQRVTIKDQNNEEFDPAWAEDLNFEPLAVVVVGPIQGFFSILLPPVSQTDAQRT